jgi:TolB protein
MLLTSTIVSLLAMTAGGIPAEQPAAKPAEQPAGQPAAETKPAPLDWSKLEAPLLTNHKQLTFRDKFVKAGENYFSPDGKMIVFQAIEVPEKGKNPEPYYAMYVAKLDGDKLTDVEKVSPPGSANTCGWFHPTEPRVIFGSTIIVPKEDVSSGYQRGTSRYRWAFPAEMDIVSVLVPPAKTQFDHLFEPEVIFERPNYDAECSFDKTGRFILYAHIEDAPKPAADAPKDAPPPKPDANLYIYDTKTKKDYPIVVAPGYDGGPFFSPSGEWICYRSDRRGNDELQLFVAKLAFTKDADGTMIPTGIEQEFQITDNAHVNWCPFFHPSGDYLVYATSEVGHQNYEVFAIELNAAKFQAAMKTGGDEKTRVIADMPHIRITHADGADVLPVFSPDGKKMLWCSQRGPKIEGEPRPSSQVWIADWNGTPFKD